MQSVSRGGIVTSAVLMVTGVIAGAVATVYHPTGIDPNNHALVFVQYAHSAGWTADHLGYFVATTLTIAGFLVLIDAMRLPEGMARMTARLGYVFGAAALAMTAVRYAVDGVVLKRAVDAWTNAPAGEQAARFAAAEIARWTEEASVSYQSFLLGLTLLVLAGLIIATARIPRPVGILFVIGGAGYVAVGWFLGESGFGPSGALPTYAAQTTPLVCAAYLAVVAWRMPRSTKRQAAGSLASNPVT